MSAVRRTVAYAALHLLWLFRERMWVWIGASMVLFQLAVMEGEASTDARVRLLVALALVGATVGVASFALDRDAAGQSDHLPLDPRERRVGLWVADTAAALLGPVALGALWAASVLAVLVWRSGVSPAPKLPANALAILGTAEGWALALTFAGHAPVLLGGLRRRADVARAWPALLACGFTPAVLGVATWRWEALALAAFGWSAARPWLALVRRDTPVAEVVADGVDDPGIVPVLGPEAVRRHLAGLARTGPAVVVFVGVVVGLIHLALDAWVPTDRPHLAGWPVLLALGGISGLSLPRPWGGSRGVATEVPADDLTELQRHLRSIRGG